ncbi:AAA family ATPase [Methylophilus sp. 13]|uniref:AAA family ATPase n=1 Tax=Methylophilus sp. 13 TaxID=2781018 RepID=UPI00188F10AB|nr:AAA family ATPase [Methylophilus sp. 13]MBF5037951.1 AAA family ATPase [Methylophilus sp. 13]
MNLELVRSKLWNKFANVTEVSSGILKGIRRNGERDVAAYVFDLNSKLPDTAGELNEYLDSIMGPIYFDRDFSNDLRWNSYLYFVVGNDLKNNSEFRTYKRNLEADKNYARKFVVYEDEIDRVLKEIDSVESSSKPEVSADVIEVWSKKLNLINQDDILDVNRPIADVVRGIATGNTKNTIRNKKTSGEETSKSLAGSHLSSINLEGFRSHAGQKCFEGFGKANLIFGVNGVGKTSLMEGIEFLYCGASKRSGLLTHATVEGRLDSGLTVKTSVDQAISDFKTRQRLWYGADDTATQNRLPNQFARFNFLNTDAAAEFTLLTEGKATDNAKSLSTILNGSEATSMWKRIHDVSEEIKSKIKSIRSERVKAVSDKSIKDSELEKLQVFPQQSDSTFDIVVKSLELLRWKDLPTSKNQVNVGLADRLLELTTQLSILNRINWVNVPLSLVTIRREYESLVELTEDLNESLNSKALTENLHYAAVSRKSEIEESYSVISKIPNDVLTDIFRISDELHTVTDFLIKNSKLFALLPDAESPEGWESRWGNITLPSAISACRYQIDQISNQTVSDTTRYAELLSTHSQIETAKRELKNWAFQVMEHDHSESFCPTCKTPFEPEILISRINALSNSPMDSLILELSAEIDRKIELTDSLSKDLDWLMSMQECSLFLTSDMDSITVSNVQKGIQYWADSKTKSQSMKQTLEKSLQDYQAVGIHLEDIHEACQVLLENESIKNDLKNTLIAKENASKILGGLQTQIEAIESDIQDIDLKIEKKLISLRADTSQSIDEVRQQLAHKIMILIRALSVEVVENELIILDPDQDLLSIYSALENVHLEVKRLHQFIESEENHSSNVNDKKLEVQKLETRINQYEGSLKQLRDVQTVLDDIIKNHSIEAASATIVEDTHEVADNIFRRIHTPSEYMISNSVEEPLVRRSDSVRFKLNQVSTGQRAAYALSMFLAMNAQVDVGPRLVLLDDPISHVDDLNALSFLDYLRNLVINSDRQLFFATADEKIAGLFAHKFAFLDNDFRTFELTRKSS